MKPVLHQQQNPDIPFDVGDLVYTEAVEIKQHWDIIYKVLGFEPCKWWTEAGNTPCENQKECRYDFHRFVIQNIKTKEVQHLCMGIKRRFWERYSPF